MNFRLGISTAIAAVFACYSSYYLQLDKPYWAVMTTLIVSYPSHKDYISKTVARLVGTCIGVLAINLFSNWFITYPTLLSCNIILWLSFCSYVASRFKGMYTYGASLCGYTSAIIGFAIANRPSSYSVFFISQARLSEILLGLFCSFITVLLIPYKEESVSCKGVKSVDEVAILKYVNKYNFSIFALKEMIVDLKKIYKTNRGFFSNNLKSNVDSSTNQIIASIVYFSDQIVSQRANRKYTLSEISKMLVKYDDYNNFFSFFIHFNGSNEEAKRNSFRTAFLVLVAVWFWLSTNWSFGYIFPIVVSICCVLGATYEKVNSLVNLVAISVFVSFIVSYIMKFYFFVNFNSMIPSMIIFGIYIIITNSLKSISPIMFIVFHVNMLATTLMLDFSNPMSYDYSKFLNLAFVILSSFIFVSLSFVAIPKLNGNKLNEELRRKIIKNYYLGINYNYFFLKTILLTKNIELLSDVSENDESVSIIRTLSLGVMSILLQSTKSNLGEYTKRNLFRLIIDEDYNNAARAIRLVVYLNRDASTYDENNFILSFLDKFDLYMCDVKL